MIRFGQNNISNRSGDDEATQSSVTGAGKRIGAGLSKALAESGWHVVLHYNQAAKEAHILCETMAAAGKSVELVQADLAKPAHIEQLMAQASSSGPLDAVINNASLFVYDDSATVSAAEIDRHMAVNVTAPALLIRALHDQMPKGRQGVVINMLDAKLFGINPDYFSYTLSKSACHTLTQIRMLCTRACGQWYYWHCVAIR